MTEEVWIVRVLLRLTSFSKKLWLYRKSLDDSGLKQIKHYRKTLWLLLDEHCTTELKQNSCIHFCIKRLSGRALSFECCIKSKKCVKKLKPRLWPDKCLTYDQTNVFNFHSEFFTSAALFISFGAPAYTLKRHLLHTSVCNVNST